MPAAKTTRGPELTLEQRRERRRLRREKQRENNVHRAAKMHAARLKMEAIGVRATAEPKASLYVGCSGWRYWDWRDFSTRGRPNTIGSSTICNASIPSRTTHRSTRGLRWRMFRRGSAVAQAAGRHDRRIEDICLRRGRGSQTLPPTFTGGFRVPAERMPVA